STIVRPSRCSPKRSATVISMLETEAWASLSITRTFLLCSHERVSASADTIVDLPTPPFVFITAIVLRITPPAPLRTQTHLLPAMPRPRKAALSAAARARNCDPCGLRGEYGGLRVIRPRLANQSPKSVRQR